MALKTPVSVLKMRRRALEIWHAPTVGPAEMILSLMAIAYGAGLLLPLDEFVIYRSRGQMASGFGETTWASMFLMIGMTRVGSILTRSYRGRLLTTLISIGLWLYLAISFLIASPVNQRVVLLFTLALCEWWTLLRIHRRE